MYFSKSKYCNLWQCPKSLWLRKYKPEVMEVDESVEARFVEGNVVGDLAMELFGDFVEVTAHKDDGSLDLAEMIERTKIEIEKGTENICEASFSFEGLYCAVDILRKNGNAWDIYEVKSSTHGTSAVYIADVSYQKYVLENCGVRVNRCYTVCINSDYIRGDELDIRQLFKITDVTDYVDIEIRNVYPNLQIAESVLSSTREPEIEFGEHCRNPYWCAFYGYCTSHLPKPNVFDLYRMSFPKAYEHYQNGVITYEDALASKKIRNEKQLRQMEYYLEDKGTYVEKDNIRAFLSQLSYPLYFLDFETMQIIVPEFKGTKPYQQIPFQYSLHYIEQEGGELKHKEFLAVSGENPLRAIAERLCEDIPMNVCTTAYNKSFECTRLKELAEMFPDLSEHLINIADHIVDLLTPFQSGYYYNKAMGGSFSIKSVLPAIFPDDPSLDYHNLEGVHNGGEAMTIFPLIKNMPPDEQGIARHNLLKYCELDTYAMVKVWQELERVTKEL